MFNPHEQKELCAPDGLPVAVAKVSLYRERSALGVRTTQLKSRYQW